MQNRICKWGDENDVSGTVSSCSRRRSPNFSLERRQGVPTGERDSVISLRKADLIEQASVGGTEFAQVPGYS